MSLLYIINVMSVYVLLLHFTLSDLITSSTVATEDMRVGLGTNIFTVDK